MLQCYWESNHGIDGQGWIDIRAWIYPHWWGRCPPTLWHHFILISGGIFLTRAHSNVALCVSQIKIIIHPNCKPAGTSAVLLWHCFSYFWKDMKDGELVMYEYIFQISCKNQEIIFQNHSYYEVFLYFWSRRACVHHPWWRTKRSWPLFSPTFYFFLSFTPSAFHPLRGNSRDWQFVSPTFWHN